MSERKVINKYYHIDFDPALIPRRKGGKNDQLKVRMMMPMSVRCNTCGNYIYKGTKFNSRKETAGDYLGIPIYRLYFKCSRCSAEITIKTDPQNSDYVVELGATKNYEHKKDEHKAMDEFRQEKLAKETGDAMTAMETKAFDNKREMEDLDRLDELRAISTMHSKVDLNDIVVEGEVDDVDDEEGLNRDERRKLDQALQKMQHRRLEDDPEEDIFAKRALELQTLVTQRKEQKPLSFAKPAARLPPKLAKQPQFRPEVEADQGLLGLGDYADADDM